MGLDCTAFSNLRHLPDFKRPETDEEWDAFWENEDKLQAYAYVGFEQSTRGLVNHDVVTTDRRGHEWLAQEFYEKTPETEEHGWRAGSYGGYSMFRESLAEIAGWSFDYRKDTDEEVEANRDKPFFELVWFADNEGTIGPEAAADLLKDFEDYKDEYVAKHAGDGTYFAQVYVEDWIPALRLAAQGGLIDFH